MRHLLFHMPAWMVGLVAAAFVAQIVLQLELEKKWRAPALAGALALVLAGTVWYWHASLPVYAYGVMLAAAAVVAISVGLARCPFAGFDPVEMVDFGLYVVLWGVVGARVFHVFENLDKYPLDLRGIFGALAVWNGGLVFYGGMMGAMAYSAYFALRREDGPRTLVRIFDLGGPCMMFGLAFGRIGCFLNGCCFGAPTDLPWGVQFPYGSPLWGAIWKTGARSNAWRPLLDGVAQGVPAERLPCTYHVHPSQLYASVAVFAIGILLSWVFYKKWRTGSVSALLLLMYPVARFILEGWIRGDTPKIGPLGLTISQHVSLVAFAAGVVWAGLLVRAKRREATAAAGHG
ncbi:MAG: prolipoprotein diacylglyceryl transferase [Planctomycetota bacterium]